MNKLLRIVRIVVSLAVFLILSLGLAFPLIALLPGVFNFLVGLQFGQAVATMSLTVFVIWTLVTLVFGRIYCSTVCPMGTLMDFSAGCRRLTARGRRRVYRWSEPNNVMRYGMLVLVVGCVVGGLMLLPELVEPYSAFTQIVDGFVTPIVGWALPDSIGREMISRVAALTVASSMMATFLFAATVLIAYQNGRALCSTVCPVGTILGLISRYSILQIDIDTDRCTNCRRCEYACKAHCINLESHVVDSSRCVECFDCLAVCRDDAIHYTTDRKRLSQPMMQKIKGMAETATEGEAEATMDSNVKMKE